MVKERGGEKERDRMEIKRTNGRKREWVTKDGRELKREDLGRVEERVCSCTICIGGKTRLSSGMRNLGGIFHFEWSDFNIGFCAFKL